MSVTSAELAESGVGGETSGTRSDVTLRNHKAIWRVVCDREDTWDIIDRHFREDSSLPFPGRIFEAGNGRDTRSRCSRLRGTRVDKSEGIWNVEATFEESFNSFTGPENKDINGEKSDDPNDWHDEIEVSTTQMSIGVEGAFYLGNSANKNGPFIFPGKIYKPCNSAGKPFDPGLEEEIDITIFRLTKYQPIYNARFYERYVGSVNNSAIQIVKPQYAFNATLPAFTAKMKAVNSSFHVTDKGIRYWKHTLEVHIHPQSWRRTTLDQGFAPRLQAEDKRQDGTTVSSSDIPAGQDGIDEELKDEEGMALSEPVNFNGAGKRNPKSTDPPVYLNWRTYREIDWTGIIW